MSNLTFAGELQRPTAEFPHFRLEAPAEVMQALIACAWAGLAMATPGTSTEEMHLHIRMLPVLRMVDQKSFDSADALVRATANAILTDSAASMTKKLASMLSGLFPPTPKGD
jgi:hypothetical protein